MKLTKILALLLIAVFVLSPLAACGDKEEGDDETTTASNEDSKEETTTKAQETTTKAPETTTVEETTTAKKEYEYTTVKEINFTTMADGAAPFEAVNTDNLRIEGGLLKGTGTNGDPNIAYNGGDISFAADTVQEIEIKLKNYSVDYSFQLFFTTDTVSWSEGASVKYVLDYSGDDGDKNDWNIIKIDPTESADWVGTITNFRLDPSSAEGDFEVEYVKFLTKTEKAS